MVFTIWFLSLEHISQDKGRVNSLVYVYYTQLSAMFEFHASIATIMDTSIGVLDLFQLWHQRREREAKEWEKLEYYNKT